MKPTRLVMRLCLTFTCSIGLCLGGQVLRGAQGSAVWETKASITFPRGGVRFLYQPPVTTLGRIYLIYGWVFEYDPAANTWQTFKKPLAEKRVHYTAAALDGKLYAIGGFIEGAAEHWLDTVEEFDVSTATWRTRAPLPVARTNTAAVAKNGLIYVLGGTGEGGGELPILAYDPQTDSWVTKRATSRANGCHGAHVVNGRIYIFGVTGSDETLQPVLEEYDPEKDVVTPRSPLPRPRSAYATALAGARIVVLGGSLGENLPLAHVDVYDPATDAWSIGPDLPEPKCWLGAVVIDRDLYQLGGVTGDWYNPSNAMSVVDVAPLATVEDPQPFPPPKSSAAQTTPPSLLRRVEPDYPADVRDETGERRVFVSFIVNKAGKARNASAMFGAPAPFAKAAVDAVQLWEFAPAIEHGKPVGTQMTVALYFTPPNLPTPP